MAKDRAVDAGSAGERGRAGGALVRLRRRLAHALRVGLQILWWALTFQLASGLRRRRYARLIRRSGLFDRAHYLAQASDDRSACRDPIDHYLRRGADEGLDPNPLFDTSYYLERNPDVSAWGKNPLVHFIRRGAAERRNPSPRFDTCFYLDAHPEVAASGENPLAHCLARGGSDGLPPGPQESAAALLARGHVLARGPNARRVLVVDHRLPTPDQDSGSVRMTAILTLLRAMGRDVTFVAESPDGAERYRDALCALGVRVHQGYGAALAHLAAEGHDYAFALLSRPEVAHRFLPLVRAHAVHATAIFDTVDLHWRRLERAAEVTGDPAAREDAARCRKLERAAAAGADLVLAITEDERQAILAEVPGARVEVLPNIHVVRPSASPRERREGIMFIGGFEHAPNEDGVRWFVQEILPDVLLRLPGVVLRVVGSKMPERMKRLASPSVELVGQVPDPAPYFESCRVFVSPLRYGAGMKGKIGQSMSHGLPVVTTSIGAEGMRLVDGENALVADSPAAFADAVVRLYTDDILWARVARNGLREVEERYSPEAVQPRLEAIFGGQEIAGGAAATCGDLA
jgi:glycosyltransferase involved in cell wall biosynthesis